MSNLESRERAERWTPLAWAWQHIGFICIAAALVFCIVHAFDPPRLNWGDSASDYNVMTSGRNFQKYGFLRLHLTPYLLDPAYMSANDGAMVYTHYPQLPDLMNGILRKVFGLSDLVQFRFVAIAFSFGAFVFIYRLIARFWSRHTAQIAVALWATNPIWLQHADYLHHAPYASFFGSGCLYFLARYLDSDDRRWLPASGLFLFFTYLASYDYWVLVPALIALMVLSRRRAVDRAGIATVAFLAAFAVAALLFKFGTNAWALGGIGRFIHDLRFQFTERATDTVTQTAWKNGIWPTAYGRVDRFFTVLLFPIALAWLIEPRWGARIPGWRRVGPNPTFLVLVAVPFLWIFTEVWIAQYYPTLLVVPYYAVACAALAAAAWQARPRLARAGAVLLVVVLLGNSILETATFKKAFFRRADIASLRAELDAVSPLGKAVLVNHTFDAFYRYYFDRNTVAVFLNPPEQMDAAIAFYSDPRSTPFATPQGAIFVQHKRLTEQEFDKGYYYLASRYGLWNLWSQPTTYHDAVDALIAARDSQFVARIAQRADKLVETDAYAVWRVHPPAPAAPAVSGGRTPIPSPRN